MWLQVGTIKLSALSTLSLQGQNSADIIYMKFKLSHDLRLFILFAEQREVYVTFRMRLQVDKQRVGIPHGV